MSDINIKNYSGAVVIVDKDGKAHEGQTARCVHCGMQFVMEKGSGRIRGFCQGCMGITCGSKQCDPCAPWQKKFGLDKD